MNVQNHHFGKRNTQSGANNHTVVFVAENQNLQSVSNLCSDVLRNANRVAKIPYYDWMFCVGLQQTPVRKTVNKQSDTVVVLGRNDIRWDITDESRTQIRCRLPSFDRVGLVGGAIFLAASLGFSREMEISVNAELRFAAEEVGCNCVNTPTSSQGRLRTAVSGIAAILMMLDLIEEDLGRYIAETVAEKIGLPIAATTSTPASMAWYLRHAAGAELPTKAIKLMFNNVENPLPTVTVAQMVNTSVRHLERIFRNTFSQSPGEAYRNIRLDHATQLLKNTDLSILEVGLASGFTTKENFRTRYKRKYGMTPSEVRHSRYYVGPQMASNSRQTIQRQFPT